MLYLSSILGLAVCTEQKAMHLITYYPNPSRNISLEQNAAWLSFNSSALQIAIYGTRRCRLTITKNAGTRKAATVLRSSEREY